MTYWVEVFGEDEDQRYFSTVGEAQAYAVDSMADGADRVEVWQIDGPAGTRELIDCFQRHSAEDESRTVAPGPRMRLSPLAERLLAVA